MYSYGNLRLRYCTTKVFIANRCSTGKCFLIAKLQVQSSGVATLRYTPNSRDTSAFNFKNSFFLDFLNPKSYFSIIILFNNYNFGYKNINDFEIRL